MKSLFSILLFVFLFSISGYSQNIAVNTTGAPANSSAILDLSNVANLGFLPPSVALTAINSALPITTPATGLVVYNTANAGVAPNAVVSNHYYYWDGAKWVLEITQSRIVLSEAYFTGANLGNNQASTFGAFNWALGVWTPATATSYQIITTSGIGAYFAPATETLNSLTFTGWVLTTSANSVATIYIMKYSLGVANTPYANTLVGTNLGSQTITLNPNTTTYHFSINAGNVSVTNGDVIFCVILNNASGGNRIFISQGQLQFYINGVN